MPKIDDTKEADVKREVRTLLAINPMISSRALTEKMRERGYPLDRHYLLKIIHKLNGEIERDIDSSEIRSRMAQTRERFQASFERLFKIAFWEWKYLEEGVQMPETKDQIKALEVIMKMDIALIEAEMDAGIFKRHLGTLAVDPRNVPISQDRKEAIMIAMKNWGMLPQQFSLPAHGSEQPTTENAGAAAPAPDAAGA